ncbi:phage tail protein [Pseudomonas kurunegalensis]|uniref:phage tail protein n=1 Tax=Pseudomonas kurunegalensis TaxID=485880 RepID=UPI00256FFF10|nr:phage tail protein [Pseudomonas kurunegalensis]WJD60894.1 phage tail protein [Pseudomonas kurunegalensis]
MMLALGMFVFSLDTLAYQEMNRQTDWRHASSNRVGAQPARQFVGRGDDSVTLPGVLLPELAGDITCLDELRGMANTGKAWPMVDGNGRMRGLYVIESLSEGQTLFFQDGTPRRIDFTLSLQRTDEGRVDLQEGTANRNSRILRQLS